MSALLVLYALYCAYRDRELTRARSKARAHRNPYSRADMLSRAYNASIHRDYCYASMGQMYAGAANPNVKAWYRRA